MRWPSATGSGESVAIFLENVHAASHVNLLEELAVNRTWFDAIADGTPISHFLPELQGYSLYPLDEGSDP